LTIVIVLKGGETVPIENATDEQIASALAFVKKQE